MCALSPSRAAGLAGWLAGGASDAPWGGRRSTGLAARARVGAPGSLYGDAAVAPGPAAHRTFECGSRTVPRLWPSGLTVPVALFPADLRVSDGRGLGTRLPPSHHTHTHTPEHKPVARSHPGVAETARGEGERATFPGRALGRAWRALQVPRASALNREDLPNQA